MATMEQKGFWDDAPVISCYTRTQAIEDGVLVDLSEIAPKICREHFKTPIACTNTVWGLVEDAIKAEGSCASIDGVLHDIFWMSKAMARELDPTTRLFKVIIHGEEVELKVVCGPGDTPEPVLTFMLKGED